MRHLHASLVLEDITAILDHRHVNFVLQESLQRRVLLNVKNVMQAQTLQQGLYLVNPVHQICSPIQVVNFVNLVQHTDGYLTLVLLHVRHIMIFPKYLDRFVLVRTRVAINIVH